MHRSTPPAPLAACVQRASHAASALQLPAQRLDQSGGQHGVPILPALAIAHQGFPPSQIDVLDAQAHRFHQSQTGTVHQARQQPVDAIQPCQQGVHFLAVEKQNRRQRLVLRRSRDVLAHRKVGEKRLDHRRTHVAGMAFAMMQNEAAYPVGVSLLGTQAVMLDATAFTHLIQQARRLGGLHGVVCSLGCCSLILAHPCRFNGLRCLWLDYTAKVTCCKASLSPQNCS